MKKRVLIVVGAILLIGIAAYLVSAYSFHAKVKKQFTNGMEQTDVNTYTLYTDEGIYGCFLSNWWVFGGNLNISSKQSSDGEGNAINEYYVISIPLVKSNGGYEFHVSLGYEDENGDIKNVQYVLDENMEFIDPDDVSSVQATLFEGLKPRILELYEKVYDMWGIFNPNEVE